MNSSAEFTGDESRASGPGREDPQPGVPGAHGVPDEPSAGRGRREPPDGLE